MKYSDQLKDPRWQKKRLLIFQRDDFRCVLCQNPDNTLSVHHKKYSKGRAWESPDDDLITLCNDCHKRVEEVKEAVGYALCVSHSVIDCFDILSVCTDSEIRVEKIRNLIIEAFHEQMDEAERVNK